MALINKHKTSHVILKNVPKGIPKEEDFQLVTDKDLPELKDGELLLEALYVSVDPYLRGMLGMFQNNPVPSGQVAKVIESKDANFKNGDIVMGIFPWSTFHIVHASKATKIPPKITIDNEKKELDVDFEKIDYSYFLGVMGMPGSTAYYGLFRIGDLKNNSNVLISGAGGAVGSIAGQIAKIRNCYVVGTAGTAEKIDWLKKECLFDNVINYKDYKDIPSVQKKLKDLFPNGIDLYFDNTGGIISHAVWDLLNKNARVVVCGQISNYNALSHHEIPKCDDFLFKTIYKSIRIEGFTISDWKDWSPFYQDMNEWLNNGKITIRETTFEGFDQIPRAFIGLFTGDNIGKMLIKIVKK